MGLSKDDYMALLKHSVNLRIDASGMSHEDLVALADFAFKADCVVTLKNIGDMSLDDLLAIAEAGRDSVTIDL